MGKGGFKGPKVAVRGVSKDIHDVGETVDQKKQASGGQTGIIVRGEAAGRGHGVWLIVGRLFL